MSPRQRRSPGGVGDGLPALPSGEPILARWFVISMILLVIAASVVTVLAFVVGRRDPLSAAQRRPVGTDEVTHDRGQAALAEDLTTESGPRCGSNITLLGDDSGRAASGRALAAACVLLGSGQYPDAEQGLSVWSSGGGALRVAVFELSGVDSSARLEDGRVVIELNAKFQFEDAARAAPLILHELVHLGQGWPGQAVTAEAELAATRTQAQACDDIGFRENPPRGCLDVNELLGSDDPLGDLREAGYRPTR